MNQNLHSYEDIIHLPHHQSTSHPHMDMWNRAAQFSPFAALTGYEGAIKETSRLTSKMIDLDEGEKARLDEVLNYVKNHFDQMLEVKVTYFEPDLLKDGGDYLTRQSVVKKIDENNRVLIFEDGNSILMDAIVQMDIVD